eukprot:3183291-Pyramimonas_sp.AAC.1
MASCLGPHAVMFEDDNGVHFRQFCQTSDFMVATAAEGPGPTLFGPKGGTSRIDHFTIPQGAAHLVQKCIALHTSGKRLQLMRSRGSRDHVPIGMVIDAR